VAQLPSLEGMQAQTSRLLRREGMAFVLPSASPLPGPAANSHRPPPPRIGGRGKKKQTIWDRASNSTSRSGGPADRGGAPTSLAPTPVAPNPKESPALPSHGVRTERRMESHGVDPSYPMGKQGPALLARFLFERYPYGPLALLLWVGPMTQRVDLTRSHFD
jgi:hypothetical protein